MRFPLVPLPSAEVLEGLRLLLHIIEEEADITPQRHIEQAPIVSQVGIMFEIGIDIVADLGERLIDVFDVVVRFQREDRVRIQLPFVDAADNGAAIEPTLRELWGVTGLADDRT